MQNETTAGSDEACH